MDDFYQDMIVRYNKIRANIKKRELLISEPADSVSTGESIEGGAVVKYSHGDDCYVLGMPTDGNIDRNKIFEWGIGEITDEFRDFVKTETLGTMTIQGNMHDFIKDLESWIDNNQAYFKKEFESI